jgi:hypothetical protein
MKTYYWNVSFAVVILIFLLFADGQILAQWSISPLVNNPICTAANDQMSSTIITDGAGGAIITWQDYRSGTNWDIYAQRINSAGTVQWGADGVAICTAANAQSYPTITTDGAGGAIITWADSRSGTNNDIYAQRINTAGIVQWIPNGVVICTATNSQNNPAITTDGAGGAIITWQDGRSGTDNDIYAQRINAAGTVQWTANGAAICTAENDQRFPAIIADGAGGAIITWEDSRSGINKDIYAQRINAAGTVQWTVNGAAISTASNDQQEPMIITDGTDGAIITWADSRSGNWDIYAQRINAAGTVQWTADGAAICAAASDQITPIVTTDDAGGAIIAWRDDRSGNWDIYAQWINALGNVQWTADGAAICTAVGAQFNPTITTDGAGGAIIMWQDGRRVANSDIYAQRINAAGIVQWITNGAAICTATNDQWYPQIITDGLGGVIITWQDNRSGSNWHIYAQNVDRNGYLGHAWPHIQAVRDVKNDQGGKVTVAWNRSYLDTFSNQIITQYSIWRGISVNAIPPQAHFNGTGKTNDLSADAAFRTIVTASGTTYWELVGTMASHYFPSYSFTASTLMDSGAWGTSYQKFLVSAQTSNQFVFWDSNIDSSYSVDNLPPSATTSLAAMAESGPSVALHWSKNIVDPDVGYYEVHRSITSGFTPTPDTKIGQTVDNALIDNAPVAGVANYYRLLTIDIHGNQSMPSTQAVATIQSTQQYAMYENWNMVSIPLTVNDYAKTALFPSAASDAFAYNAGYTPEPILANGVGYWVKFSSIQSIPMYGVYRMRDTFSVVPGWNMIGSISKPIAVSAISSKPAGIITTQFFGYHAGYNATDSLRPGKGYWVKVEQRGSLILTASSVEESFAGKIRIVPTSETPPIPPDRNNLEVSAVPANNAISQNYPNPFNPITIIQYQLPKESFVRLAIYNVVGQELRILVSQTEQPGYKSVQFDASSLPSGIYFYRITAGTFTDVKKMLLMK